jgi:hypothetical protein
MSYEIFYGKQFVKLNQTEEVMPMVLAGSNNCYEIGRNGGTGRRERNWFNMSYYTDGKLSSKPEEILNKIDRELIEKIDGNTKSQYRSDDDTPDNIRKRYGYYASLSISRSHTTGTSFDKWRNFINLPTLIHPKMYLMNS